MITVYTQNGCHFCEELKVFLVEKKIAFFEKNISECEKSRNKFLDIGGKGVPLTVIDGIPYIGLSKTIKEILLTRKDFG